MKYLSYIAMSKDGFVATSDDKVDFLDDFFGVDLGEFAYDKFYSQVDTVVMGRATYDFVAKHVENGGEDPYKGKKVYILTRRRMLPILDAKVTAGTADELNEIFEKDGCENIWIMGGANVHQQFIDAKYLKRAQVFVVPTELKEGIKLFPKEYKPSEIIKLDQDCEFHFYDFN